MGRSDFVPRVALRQALRDQRLRRIARRAHDLAPHLDFPVVQAGAAIVRSHIATPAGQLREGAQR
jgi:hypothetical protein